METESVQNTGIELSDVMRVVGIIADILSILAFGLTLYVLLTIRKIKNYYVFKARVPDLLKAITRHCSELVRMQNDFENFRPEILREFGMAEVTLKSLSSKVDNRQVSDSIIAAQKQIAAYKNNQRKNEAWDLYISLQKLSQEITNLQEDRKWESNNA